MGPLLKKLLIKNKVPIVPTLEQMALYDTDFDGETELMVPSLESFLENGCPCGCGITYGQLETLNSDPSSLTAIVKKSDVEKDQALKEWYGTPPVEAYTVTMGSPGSFLKPVSTEQALVERDLSRAAGNLPGMMQEVVCPACVEEAFPFAGRRISLMTVIIQLNDVHQWSREKIADWLDELADKGEIDIDFPTPE